MALKLDLNEDFMESEEQRLPPSSSRVQHLGPWVETFTVNSSRIKQINKYSNCKQNNEQKKVQFLQALNRQVEVKRKRFRTMIQKAESVEKQIHFKDFHQINKNYSGECQIPAEVNVELFSKYEQDFDSKDTINKGKKALNTTMYVYECQPPRKSSRLYRTTRAISFGHTSPIRKEKIDTENEKQQLFLGSKNLQRILRMKQKLRVKNSYLVKKIKQKQIQSDKEITQKYLSDLHGLKSWKSITLDTQRSKQKLQTTKFKLAHSNFKIIEPNLHPKKSTAKKYFN